MVTCTAASENHLDPFSDDNQKQQQQQQQQQHHTTPLLASGTQGLASFPQNGRHDTDTHEDTTAVPCSNTHNTQHTHSHSHRQHTLPQDNNTPSAPPGRN
ncbi:hypothetical protein MN608_09856 [Microdochium nivale]|nr:hypothetical protein MN608_09856 [Microdochium nivale]